MTKSQIQPKEAKQSQFYIWILIIGYFFSSIVFFSQINDEALLPRFALLSITLFAGIIIFLFSRKLIQLKNGVNIITVVGVVYYLYNLLNSFKTHNPAEGIFESQRVLLFVLILFFAFVAMKDGKLFNTIFIKMTLIIGVLTICFATYQYSKIYGIGDPWYYYTIYSFNAHKNLFSSYLFLLLIFASVGVFSFQNLKWKLFSILASCSYLFFIILVQTRATWIGLFVAFLFFIIHYSIYKFFNKPKLIPSALMTFVCIILLSCASDNQNSMVSSYFEKMKFWKYSESYSGNERIVLWKKTISLFKDNFLFGSGTGDWQISFLKYGSEGLEIAFRANTTFQRPHNDWLWVLSEQGIVGFILFGFLLIFPLYVGLRTFYKKKDLQILILLSGLIGYLVISFFDFPKERFEHLILLGVIIANLYSKSSTNDNIKIPTNYSPSFFLIIPILLCFNLLVAKKRLDGEKNAYQMFQAFKKNDFERVIYYGKKSKSNFYSIDGTSIPLDWYIGMSEYYLKINNLGLKSLENAYKLSPFNLHVINNLATTYEGLGNHEMAKKMFLETIQLCSFFEDPKFNLSVIYTNEYKFNEALLLMHSIKLDTSKRNTFIKIINERKLIKK